MDEFIKVPTVDGIIEIKVDEFFEHAGRILTAHKTIIEIDEDSWMERWHISDYCTGYAFPHEAQDINIAKDRAKRLLDGNRDYDFSKLEQLNF